MKRLVIACALFVSGCSSPMTPTAPTPVAVTPPVVTPPVVAPPVVTPPVILPAFPPNDARFDLAFYRQFVHDAFDLKGGVDVLRRQAVAPRIYLRTIHANGSPIDAFTLDQTAAALINTAGALTGAFGLAGLEQGTGTKAGQPGWITVSWLDDPVAAILRILGVWWRLDRSVHQHAELSMPGRTRCAPPNGQA
jgi:hypothetical protein